jgi:exonuclease VII large subunit
LITMNLKNNNNLTLAQAHAEKASSLLNNSTLDEIREVNNRIADSLETGLEQLEGNITTLASASQGQIPQDRIQSINQTVVSLNDTLAEAITVRVESEQQNNATTWAMALADLVNVVLSNYGNATGAPFDLTNMSNLAGMEGMQMSDNSSINNTMTMTANATSSVSNMTATIVNVEAYQSAQYLANNTTLRLFNDVLKPLTISANETSSDNNNATAMAQQGQNNVTPDNNTTSNIDSLEANLLQLKDDVNGRVTPAEIMTTVHLGIHPILMQLYGLTM